MNWADNIPEAGILCDKNGQVIKITGYDEDIDRVFDTYGNTYLIDNLTPLTPQQWWEFAPWNYDMDSAPKGEIVLLKDIDGGVYSDQFLNKQWLGANSCQGPIAWLPLPESE